MSILSVWEVRNCHMVTGLPSYIFLLLCCFRSGCKHPRCLEGKQPTTPDTWYPNGPPLSYLPLPKLVKSGVGHHVQHVIDFALDTTANRVSPMLQIKMLWNKRVAPICCPKEAFHRVTGKSITEDILEAAVLLPVQGVGIGWNISTQRTDDVVLPKLLKT